MMTMFDAIDVNHIPKDAQAAAGYINGAWPTFSSLKIRFPHALLLSIAVSADADADCLDVEPGDAVPAQVPKWLNRQLARGAWRPVLYTSASQMGAVMAAVTGAGQSLGGVRLWSAHYGAGEHICGPLSCGLVPRLMDGTQWTSSYGGASLDASLLRDDFWRNDKMAYSLSEDSKFGVAAFPAGSSTGVWFTADPTLQGKTAQVIRVAVHSVLKGWSQIFTVSVNGTQSVGFAEKDADGLSLDRTDAPSNWTPVAYHF